MIKQLLAGVATVTVLSVGGVAVAGATSSSPASTPNGSSATAQHPKAGRHGVGGRILHHAATIAADTIGIDVATLRSEVKTKGSIAAVATDHGSSAQAVIDALVAAGHTAITKAVDAGHLSADRAARMESRLTERATTFVNDTKNVVERLRHGWKRGQHRGQQGSIGRATRTRGAMQA